MRHANISLPCQGHISTTQDTSMHKDKMKIIYEHGQMDVTTILKKCNGDETAAHTVIEKAVKRYIDSEVRITIHTLKSLGETIRTLSLTLEELIAAKRHDIKQQLELYEIRTWLSINEVKEWQAFIASQEARPVNPFDATTDVPF